jgi:NAD(P)-dependent dehydrogenase (short-subunit alcohol dehydrogenase family)
MNIVIIGGGSKIGKDIADSLRDMGHKLFVLSHKEYPNMPENHYFADFENLENVLSTFNQLTKNLTIDILFYNTNHDYGPNDAIDYTSLSDKNHDENWIKNLRLAVTIPHRICIEALKKMVPGSKIVFMTTGLSTLFDKNYSRLGSYAGIKSAQNYLMYALAHNNDKKVICCSLSPHIPYDDKDLYVRVYKAVTNTLLTIKEEDNGTIIELWQYSKMPL